MKVYCSVAVKKRSIIKYLLTVVFFLVFVYSTFNSQPKTVVDVPEASTQVLSATDEFSPSQTPSLATRSATHLVTRVVDGDTIKIDYHGKIETVRLVGI